MVPQDGYIFRRGPKRGPGNGFWECSCCLVSRTSLETLHCPGGSFSESFKDQSMLGSWDTAQKKLTGNLMGLFPNVTGQQGRPHSPPQCQLTSCFPTRSWFPAERDPERGGSEPYLDSNITGAGIGK